jgi:hypothetical protein
MQAQWRLAVGVLTTSATVAAILVVDEYIINVPNPVAITFIAVVASASSVE